MPLDPGAQTVLDLIAAAGRPPYETLQPNEVRKLYAASRNVLAPDPPPVSETRELEAPGPHGAIPVRSYRPMGVEFDSVLPALIFFHGGGFVIGSRDTHDIVCRHLTNTAGCAVFSVEYRMGPEHKFPAAVDDALAATAWTIESADRLRVDRSRIAVGGDSAGGNLAAVVSLLARDRGLTELRLQLLIYPAVELGMLHDSHNRYAEGYLLTRANQRWFLGHYLRSEQDKADWRASPLRAPSLKGVPAAWILTAGYDPLCDEGEAYAERLQEEGVPAVHRRYPGQIHGFVTMGKIIPEAMRALDEAAAALKTVFSGAP
jgi:acetyl esterase